MPKIEDYSITDKRMSLEQAISLVKEASTAEGQLKMSRERWDLVTLARKIVANYYVSQL